MSEGPIKREREAFSKRENVSTSDAHRVCARGSGVIGYCGRTSAKIRSTNWDDVTCADCRASARADGLNVPEERSNERKAS